MSRTPPHVDGAERDSVLTALRNLKMARSAHSYVRGNTSSFYEWLATRQPHALPEGPALWICGDCHVGNLGPVGNINGDVQLQIRDVDQTVIGNPAHDLIRLGLSLAMAARGSDLPGVTTALMIEHLIDGYVAAMENEILQTAPPTQAEGKAPDSVRLLMQTALRRGWKELARERLDSQSSEAPKLPIGKRFWKLAKDEKAEIARLFEKGSVSRLATLLSSRPDNVAVEVLDAAYWVKGCSSLGRLRYAAILGVGLRDSEDYEHCLVDIKEAVPAAAPSYPDSHMPPDHARRVVEGARHLSPHLGERMLATQLLGKSVFMRELLPQDLKLEIAKLNATDATQVARYLAGVVGKAHARQLDVPTTRQWIAGLRKNRSKTLDAPSWLWNSIVDLVASHEAGYLEHCRLYAQTQGAP